MPAARRIMVQNVGLSLGLITALIPLALFGILGLAAVVLVHELAEVFVIANGVRAGRATTLCPRGRPATGRAHRSAVPHRGLTHPSAVQLGARRPNSRFDWS